LLDGETQVGNVVYLATTNYLSKIPSRIKNRPSRFARVIEVGQPNEEARRMYLTAKLQEDDLKYLEPMVQATDGFVIDQLKDLVISVCCFGQPISEAVMKIQEMNADSMGIDDYNEEQAQEVFSSKKNSNRFTNKGPLSPVR
jgi:SpoVK/Ycf46/Vps4 family AAA+-type ATPase